MPPAALDRMSPLPHHLTHWAGLTPDDTALTFLDYGTDPGGLARTLTWAQLDRRVTAAAARFQRTARRGDRVALLAPPGLDYVVGFLGALRAGIIAVPLFSPDLPGHGDRLAAVLTDCEPATVATVSGSRAVADAFLSDVGGSPHIVDLDDLAEDAVGPVDLDPEEVAYLQYTSGSTRTPSGVMISHRNVVANAHQGAVLYGAEYGRSTLVSWLPLFHDMGLVLTAAGGIVYGLPAVFTDPVAFLMRPVRWLEMLSHFPGGITAAPNFAFDYCAKRIPAAERAGLRLENADLIINAAEPVQAGTLDRFVETFAPHGLRPEALSAAYGLAEATVLVTCSPYDEPYRSRELSGLSEGLAVPGSGPRMVACGGAANPEAASLTVVDATGRPCPDGQVGEIWVAGPNVAAGYWKRPEESAETFRPDGRLRTGDLGVLVDGELFVTGRIKDLIIVDGRNHYPHDVEATVEDAHGIVGRHRSAAFSVPAEDGEVLVVVAEVSRHASPSSDDLDAARTAVRRAVTARHGVPVHDVVLVAPNDVPRTSSGKIARLATRARYLEGSLDVRG
ncbi:fatty acyl-AMP ligase [Cryptosporangium phraense]|uniref:Fatty acyl-AMP ligase n=1 Tax=Cryptosporangium phraense TaxID=2593070 RepID=A0A545ASQ9_9ACTN|nr:fatty acyl-AMP ligase [Cryptosporangium phraense]TQS43655.1 fatty acyl-AMP ligase [Cryptosporangium phraense]